VELALEQKADRKTVAYKADRSFCEALLSRFSVEVGRQLGDMERSQQSIQESLSNSIQTLLASASEAAIENVSDVAIPGQIGLGCHSGRTTQPASAGDSPGREGLSVVPPWSPSGASARGGSATPWSPSGASARGGSATSTRTGLVELRQPPTVHAPRSTSGSTSPKGVLPTYLFSTNEGPPNDVEKRIYAFQPRRQVVLTPGEETLIARRPHSSSGRLRVANNGMAGSKSASGLLARTPSRPPTASLPGCGDSSTMRPLRA